MMRKLLVAGGTLLVVVYLGLLGAGAVFAQEPAATPRILGESRGFGLRGRSWATFDAQAAGSVIGGVCAFARSRAAMSGWLPVPGRWRCDGNGRLVSGFG